MASKTTIIEELQWVSNRISTQVRTLGTILVAIAWGIIIGNPQIAGPISDYAQKHLLAIGLLALTALICDFLQYLFAYLDNISLLKEIERKKLDEGEYDPSAMTYKLRRVCFWAKQLLLLIACVWFLAVVVPRCI